MKKIYYLCSACIIGCTTFAHASMLSSNGSSLVINHHVDLTKGEVVRGTHNDRDYYKYEYCYDGKDGRLDKGYVWSESSKDCIARDCSAYPFSKDEVNEIFGTIEKCVSAQVVRYKYAGCRDGYYLNTSTAKCEPQRCSTALYPYSPNSKPDSAVGTYKTCKEGEQGRWGYDDCFQEDHILENGYCLNQCTGFVSENELDPNCKNKIPCKRRNTELVYQCSACNDGFKLNGNSCSANSCDDKVYPYTKESDAKGCVVVMSCKAGDKAPIFGCKRNAGCISGYTHDSNNFAKCVANTYDGYTSKSPIISNTRGK